MVNLMLQPVFLNLVKGSTDHKMTSDDLYNMWSVASRAKSAIVQGRRLENLSWRLWYTSTIRAKIEMEEKQKLKENYELDRFSDGSNSGTDHHHSSADEHEHEHDPKNSLVLPSDRPLFTSTCTSILAEIQDASFRFGQSGGNNLLHNFTNIHNFNSYNYNNNNTPTVSHNVNNIVSPPTIRAKSPGNNFNGNSQTKRKKNVEKFLKKYKSNLEDISEQFDEKLGFTDDETNNDDSATEPHRHHQLESVSPSNTVANFATDEEEGPDSIFYSNEKDFFRKTTSSNVKIKSNQISMISKLFKTEEFKMHSPTIISNLNPEPLHQFSTPKFLNNNHINSNSNSNINNQLEIMAANRYDRLSTTALTIKSPKPVIINHNNDDNDDQKASNNKRVIDASALSSSLSANKFKLEEEFDSQIVIW